jgi:hypothetical protein
MNGRTVFYRTLNGSSVATTPEELTALLANYFTKSEITSILATYYTKLDINAKLLLYSPVGHSHAIADVTNLQTTLDGKALLVHTHTINDVINLQNELDDKSDVGHSHAISNVTGLSDALSGKSDTSHTHSSLYSGTDVKLSCNSYGVGINGASADATYELKIDGDTYTSGDYFKGSDMRIKEDINDVNYHESACEILDHLRPVTFKYKDSFLKGKPQTLRYGFIAQEYEQVFPEFIRESEGFKGLSIEPLVPLLVKAVQELSKQLKEHVKGSEYSHQQLDDLISDCLAK